MFMDDTYEIGERYYSPPFGYPPQRIGSYDNILRGHITLTGAGVDPVSKPVAKQKDWQEESLYLRGLAGDIGESHMVRKERRFNTVFGYGS